MPELNQVLFDKNNNLKSDVRLKLLDIVNEFLDNISEEITIPVLDIVLLGSNAGYNYTEKSDIDVHIVIDYSKICDNLSVTSELFNAEKSLFNYKYDVGIKGIPVEVYVEDINSATISNGIYSILRDEWIKFPEETPRYEITDQDQLNHLVDLCNKAIESSDLGEVEDTLDQLYLIRKYSLSAYGEAGEGNLIFKEIRNRGLLDAMKDRVVELKSDKLSLENLNGLY